MLKQDVSFLLRLVLQLHCRIDFEDKQEGKRDMVEPWRSESRVEDR